MEHHDYMVALATLYARRKQGKRAILRNTRYETSQYSRWRPHLHAWVEAWGAPDVREGAADEGVGACARGLEVALCTLTAFLFPDGNGKCVGLRCYAVCVVAAVVALAARVRVYTPTCKSPTRGIPQFDIYMMTD